MGHDHKTIEQAKLEQANPATKLVEVRLSALTRVEYVELVEVPANITPEELNALVNERYQSVDGGDFSSDPEYWERADCYAVDSDMPDATPSMMAFRTEHGLHVERADSDACARPVSSHNDSLAYQVTEEDVQNVLSSNALSVANTSGKSFESIANEVFVNLDFELIEQAALYGDDLNEQTDYANDEIARQLREMGILEPLKEVLTESPRG